MRKKDLLNQNVLLFEQLRKVELENTSLKKKIKSLESEIATLNNKICEQSREEVPVDNLLFSEEKEVDNTINIDADTQYGADIIGKIVVRATECNNTLSLNTKADSRTLINLIIGKTEISKADILSVISDDCNFDTKKNKMDTIMNEAFEYFESVMAQII